MLLHVKDDDAFVENRKISKFKIEEFCQLTFNVLQWSTNERLVCWSGRPYMLAYLIAYSCRSKSSIWTHF
jgi:hypothetical protein